jgi:hypothetical protein
MKLIAGQYQIASNGTLPNGQFTNENDTTQQRGLNKMAVDVRKLDKMKFDVHTTKTQRRERNGADDIHHEDSGRRTPQRK